MSSNVHNVLITGASTGLGLATAEDLCRRSGQGVEIRRIILTATSQASVDQAVSVLRVKTKAGVHGIPLRLESPESVDAFVPSLARVLEGDRLSAVSLNAGVQIVDGLRRNAAGEELTIAINHVGHMRLLLRLWDTIRDGSRVVFIGSGTHNPDHPGVRSFGFRGSSFTSLARWLDGTGDANRSVAQQGLDRYANSKLANILSALELTRRVSPERMQFYAVDPGLMPGTGLARTHGFFGRIGWAAMRSLTPLLPGASFPAKSGAVIADVLLGSRSAAKIEDHYLDYDGKPAMRSRDVNDKSLAGAMLDQTFELLGGAPPGVRG